MLRVGLTGGLATGKSFVGKVLVEAGCQLLKADEVGHELLRAGQELFRRTVSEFGSSIVGTDGEIDRRKLGGLVFNDEAALEKLNSIVHPAVFAYEERWMKDAGERDPRTIAVVEAAILIETGNYRNFDRLIVTWCPEEMQVARARARSGWTEDEVRRRLARQMAAEEKKKYADYVIDSSGTEEETRHRTLAVHAELIKLEQESRLQ